MAGRPSKPTAIKDLQGTTRKDRTLPNEVQPNRLAQVPEPPVFLSAGGKREWLVVCGWLQTVGLLAGTDLSLIAAYCNEISEYWTLNARVKKEGYTITYRDELGNQTRVAVNPHVQLKNAALNNAFRLAGQFGFTPSTRSRLRTGETTDKPADPFEDFLQS